VLCTEIIEYPLIIVFYTYMYLQMLQADKADNDIAIYEFDIEVELLCRLDHPRIIRVLGAGRVPRPFIVLERLKDISEYLDLNPPSDARKTFFQKKTLPMTEVLQIAKDIADALHYCHTLVHKDAMIIHRDLKPENLGMTSDKKVKLFDFGLCRCVRRTKEEDDVYNMTGNTGSLRYMAPEVVLNEPYNEKVDVYSFAMVVWAVAKGKPPFRGFDREGHRTRVVEAGERPKLEKSWPRDFCDLLVACWHQDSTQRPTFSVISGHLAQILEDLGKGSSSSGLSLFKKMSLGGFPSLRK
jgi:serine/threonine protein kinase